MRVRGIRIAVGVVLAGLLAGAVSASNMGFALQVNLAAGGQRLHFVALPYVYLPPSPTAEELCADLGGTETVAEVLRWDEAASRFVVHPCGTTTEDFRLVEGMAYAVRNAVGKPIDALLVGEEGSSSYFTATSRCAVVAA